MAQDDTTRDDSTRQEFNEEDRLDETMRSNEADPAEAHDKDMTDLQQDMDADSADSL